MMKKNLKQTLLTTLLPVAASAFLLGCSPQAAGASSPATAGTEVSAASLQSSPASSESPAAMPPDAAGSVLLSVNPEIEIDYDFQGRVLTLEGMNEDGRDVIVNYDDYQGKDIQAVINDLVRKIYESGYFEQKVGGHEKNIVMKLTQGSMPLDDDFLEDMEDSVRKAARDCDIGSSSISISEKDMDSNGRIGLEKAMEIVLAQLDLSEADFTEREYELDDGIYELEFTANGVEYEYEVNAFNGKVMEADREHNDDWGHFDDDWDDDDDGWDDDRFDDDDGWDDDRFDDDDRWDDDRFDDDDGWDD